MNTNASDIVEKMLYPMCDYFFWGENSQCNCPIPCTETDYALTTSIADWPNAKNQLDFYEKYIKPNRDIFGDKFDAYADLESRAGNMTTAEIIAEITSIGLIPDNFIQMNILITRQNYRKNDDLPAVGWETLFSNLGGALNLWMGITILFAAEVVELVFAIVSMYLSSSAEDDGVEEEEEEDEVGDHAIDAYAESSVAKRSVSHSDITSCTTTASVSINDLAIPSTD